MNETTLLNCPDCPFRTNSEGRMCNAALVPALALLIRNQVIDRTSIDDKPEELLHSLLGLAPVSIAAHMACEAVLSVKLEPAYEMVA